ncbi:unnamed protein product [Nippostrongylus brasiliensis]|uniref:TCF3 fusion partner n=1 Tax=Nippostrongylus brasiliensis TaxID=27835 RepID=A0A0N4Y660_NIPBR|nr:unnamed protein product [Nippostrongylus brasiliensis]
MDGPVQEAEREEREKDEGPSHLEDIPHEATGGPGAGANKELPQADKAAVLRLGEEDLPRGSAARPRSQTKNEGEFGSSVKKAYL